MSATSPRLGTYRFAYGRSKRGGVADGTFGVGIAILNFGKPTNHESWVVERVFIRGAAGHTVQLIVGGDPGDPTSFDGQEQVDETTANPAVNSQDAIPVEPLESIWALVSGLPVNQVITGNIYYRILVDQVF